MNETSGYKAAKKMEELLYSSDAGIYKVKQFSKASVVTLKTAIEEIQEYWDQEVKYRPYFSIDGERVKIPVFFSKINGCNDAGRYGQYWRDLKELLIENTIFYKKEYKNKAGVFNKLSIKTSGFINKGEVNINRIKNSKLYKYITLRSEMQDFILEKVEFIIENNIIKGTYKNGTEYKILSIALNLPTEVLKLIHAFDFTLRNPKIVYYVKKVKILNIDEVIFLVLMHYLGFDVIVYAPTGYNCFADMLNVELVQEYQIGNYYEKLSVPNMKWV